MRFTTYTLLFAAISQLVSASDTDNLENGDEYINEDGQMDRPGDISHWSI